MTDVAIKRFNSVRTITQFCKAIEKAIKVLNPTDLIGEGKSNRLSDVKTIDEFCIRIKKAVDLRKKEAIKKQVAVISKVLKVDGNGKAEPWKTVSIQEQVKIQKLVGHDVEIAGANHVIEPSSIRHSFNRHGEKTEKSLGEKREDQIPITEDDILLIPEIIDNPDNIEFSIDETRTFPNALIYTKNIGGEIFVLEEMRDGKKKKSLAFKSMWKKRATAMVDDSPGHTSETAPEIPASFDVNLDEKSENVKENQPSGNITANDLKDFAITPVIGSMSYEPEESRVPGDWLVFNKKGYESNQVGHKSWHHGQKGTFTAIDPKAGDAKAKLFVIKRQKYSLVDHFTIDQAKEMLKDDPEWSADVDNTPDDEIEGDLLMARALSYGMFSKLSDTDRKRFVSDTKIEKAEMLPTEDYSVEYDVREKKYKISEDGEVLFKAKYSGVWETKEGKVPKRYLPQLEKVFKEQNLIDENIPEKLWHNVQYWVESIESDNSRIGIGLRNGDTSPYLAFRKRGFNSSGKGIDAAHRFKNDLDTLKEIARYNWRNGDKKDEYKGMDGRQLNSLWKKLTGEKAKGIGPKDIETLGSEADNILEEKRKFSGTGWTEESLFNHLYNRLKGIGESLTIRKRQAKRHIKGQVTKKKKSGHRLQGRIRVYGLDIAIENKKGSKRKGTDPNGKAWETTMKWPYGYIRGSLGKDADAVDTFVGPDKKALLVYVVAQHKVEITEKSTDGRDSKGRLWKDSPEAYDEDKVMLCFKSKKAAIKAYKESYDRPELFLGQVSTYTVKDFNKVLKKTFGKKIPIKIGEKLEYSEEWIGVDLDGIKHSVSEVLPDKIAEKLQWISEVLISQVHKGAKLTLEQIERLQAEQNALLSSPKT